MNVSITRIPRQLSLYGTRIGGIAKRKGCTAPELTVILKFANKRKSTMNMSFQRGLKVKEALDIGTIHLTRKWLKENTNLPDDCKIDPNEVDGYPIFYVDFDGDVIINGFNLEDVASIPRYIKFRNVTGKFILGNNKK